MTPPLISDFGITTLVRKTIYSPILVSVLTESGVGKMPQNSTTQAAEHPNWCLPRPEAQHVPSTRLMSSDLALIFVLMMFNLGPPVIAILLVVAAGCCCS